MGQISNALKALNALPNFDRQADYLRDELKVLLLRVRLSALATDRQSQLTTAQITERNELELALRSWFERYNLWITLDGGKYGITTQPQQ
ncbi:MAG: hypothetical protein WKF84_03680 [Pyrinomonadaceae bacterium]